MHDEYTPSQPQQVPPLPPSGPAFAPQPHAMPPCAPPPWAYQRRPSLLRRLLMGMLGLVFVGSIIMNLYLLAMLGTRLAGGFDKSVVRAGSDTQQIALYEVNGAIDEQASQQFSRFYEDIRSDANVKAVVLRINSPGGGVTASDQIHHLVGLLQESGRTVVVSMGGTAASGGYYIAASADEIVAEPTTVTGSIGVIMYWPVLEGTLEKLGVDMVVIKSQAAGAWKDEGSAFAMPEARHREHLRQILDDIQKKFESIVVEGRGERLKTRTASFTMITDASTQPVTVEETEPLNGKIYLADEAQELGLIDQIGYLPTALDRAAELESLDKPKVVRYQSRKGFWDEVLMSSSPPALSLSVKTIEEFQTPRIMLMW